MSTKINGKKNMTAEMLKVRFDKVATLFSDVIIFNAGGKTLNRTDLFVITVQIKAIQNEIESGVHCSLLGEMYKAGILAGCNSCLLYLKEKFNVTA